MSEENFCRECNQKYTCRQAFEQAGKIKGGSVVLKTIVAFLLPLMVFIAGLAVFEKMLPKIMDTKNLQTPMTLLLASLTTLIYILIIKQLTKKGK